jgi:rRNA maturation endonuclease Nob1
MGTRHYECVECDAVFQVKHELDPDYYEIEFCAFCGSELSEDQSEDEYYGEE